MCSYIDWKIEVMERIDGNLRRARRDVQGWFGFDHGFFDEMDQQRAAS
jgi:hypothetical protein